MSKFALRVSILLVSLYMLACYILMLTSSINLWSHTYTVIFELCLCLCISAQGNYHCKYMRWTLYGITIADTLTSIDELFDIVPYTIIAYAPAIVITLGLLTTTTLAIRHYFKVRRFKKRWQNNSRQY